MGLPRDRKKDQILLKGRNGSIFSGGYIPATLVWSVPIRTPAPTADTQVASKDCSRQCSLHSHQPILAQATLVPGSLRQVLGPACKSISVPRDHGDCCWIIPEPRAAETYGMASVPSSPSLSQSELDVIQSAYKPSTRANCAAKWAHLSELIKNKGWVPATCSIQDVLEYLLLLKHRKLSNSSTKVYLATLSAFHVLLDGKSIFNMSRSFLKGLQNLYPPVPSIVPQWPLTLVLTSLMWAPFESMASCDINYLTWKWLF